jgi:acyl-coenzyme A synthetase/AMP-(fatty) acid ligase
MNYTAHVDTFAQDNLPPAHWQPEFIFELPELRFPERLNCATEMLHIFISADEAHARPGATGKVVPGYRACIMDDEGRPLPPGQVGRLAVKGPTGCRYLADEERGQIVKAYVVPRPGVAPSAELAKELQEFVKQTIAPYKYPRAIEFRESLPRTETGKVQRFKLREESKAGPRPPL